MSAPKTGRTTACQPCCSCACTTPAGRRWRSAGSTASPAATPSPGRAAPSRPRRSTPPRCGPWPRSASTSRTSTRSRGRMRSSAPRTSSSPWVAAMPVRSSPASATRTGSSTTPPARTSKPSGRSATRSSVGCVRYWPVSTFRSPDPRPHVFNDVRCARFSSTRRLLDVHARDGARHDQPLDLAGALEDRVDLAVAVPTLDRVFADVAVAAKDLNRLLCHPHRGLTREQLRHRALTVLEGLARAGHPRGTAHEKPGRVDVGLHVRELEGDALVLDDRPVELPALLGVVERELVGRARDAHSLGADGGP